MREAQRPRRRRHGLPGVAIVPAVSALAVASPLAAAGVAVLIMLGIGYLLAPPATIIAATALMLTAFPKAGFNAGSLPVPLLMFALFAALPFLRRMGEAPRRGVRLALVALGWLLCRLIVMAFAGGGPGDLLALIGWYGLPLALILFGPALGSVRGEDGRRWSSSLEIGVFVACSFALVQLFFGLARTAVPGLTLALGEDYALKPLFFVGGSKIPSTYQNGNVLGVATGFFFLLVAERFMAGDRSRRNRLFLLATAVATFLSGSRTVVIGLVLGLVALILSSKRSRRSVATALVFGIATLGVLQLSPAIGDRILGTRGDDPNIEFRTSTWSRVLHTSSTWRLLVGGTTWVEDYPDPGQVEGLLGAIQQVGILGVGLFVATLLAATNEPGLRRWRILLIPVAFSVVVDSAYLVFPTLFIPLARMFAPREAEFRARVPDGGAGPLEPNPAESDAPAWFPTA